MRMRVFNHSIISTGFKNYPRYIFIKTPNIPYSIVSLWFRAGSRFDLPNKEGIAHLIEHLLMLNFKKINPLNEKGIISNAFTSQDLAYYYSFQLPEDTGESFTYFLKALFNSDFTDKDLALEKKVILDEQKRQDNDSSRNLWYLANKGLWPGTSLEHKALGTANSLANIRLSDVKKFAKKYYAYLNLTIVVLSSNEKIHSDFGKEIVKLKPKKEIAIPKEIFPRPLKYITDHKKGEYVQLAFSLLTRGNKSKNDAVSIRFIRHYLAGSSNSVLNERLRYKRKLTYWVNGYTRDYPDTGTLRFTLSTTRKNVKQVVKIVTEEISLLKHKKIKEEELAKHKKTLRLDLFLNSLQTKSLLLYYGWNSLVYNYKTVTLDDYLDSLKTLSPGTIQSTSKKQLNNLSVAAIGPLSEEDLTI